MTAVADFVGWLTFPPSLSLVLLLAAGLAWMLRWRKSGVAFGSAALAWSLLWSLPACSDWLRATLERRTPVVAEAQLPLADAIVVLGGADPGYWVHRDDVRPEDLKSSRLAAGARAWMAGRAPIIILSGGGGPKGPSEAATMAKAITRLGIPRSALLLEERSRDTRDNAVYTAQLASRLGMRRVLLVTSAVHMPRASLQFRRAGLVTHPAPAPEYTRRRGPVAQWRPSHSALQRSGRALKEYAGLLAAHVEWQLEGMPVGGRRNARCLRVDASSATAS